MHNALNLKFVKNRETMLLLSIIIIGAVISVTASEFLQFKNISNILANNAMYGIMAIGMTLIIVTGNIDVSVGALFAVIGMVAGTFVNFADKIGITTPIVVFAVSIAAGMMLGFINGYLAAKIKLPAVIITLGTMSIMRGALLLVTKGAWVSTMPGWFTKIASVKLLGLYIPAYIWLVTAVIIFLILRYTMLGRNILAVGGNPVGAARIGISQETVYIFVFTAFGAIIGVGGTIYIACLGSAQPVAGMGYEMTLIAAVIIGGNSFFGGKASVLGTCLGVILLGVINNAMVLMRIPVYWQSFVTGLIIIIAIILSHKKGER
jgi:ribose/xylose/arabinose/galactoside ABC-type transport system permease subunit